MFYYPNVLQRHSGCFSTIWLAATRGSRIVKREYLKVNVIKTCQKIVQYILQQVPPPYHGSPIPRLSLYLSAQLSYGVVCVYHRQCDLLIEEMKITVERLYKAEKLAKIDLVHTEQPLLLPDNLMLMEMLEDAPDPFFGMMEVSPELPEPMLIPQLCMILETSGPEIVRLEKTPPRRKRASRRDTSHLTSPELITIKEVEPAPLPSTEFGQDLPEVSALDFELLVPEIPPFPEAETLTIPRKRRISGELDKGEHPKEVRPKEPKKVKETINGIETEGEKHMEDTTIEAESKKRVLYNMEKEIKRLKEEKRQSELLWEHERERERKEVIGREERYQQEVEREMESLKKAIMQLKHLQRRGAAEELLLENQKQIENLKKIQKERQRQWEAERLEQQLQEEERERQHLKEIQLEKQKIRQAEQEIRRLKKAVSEKEADENGMEPDKKMRKKEESIDEIRRSETAERSTIRPSPKSGLPSEMLSEQDAAALLDEVTRQPIAFFPEGVLEIQSPVAASPHVSPRLSSPQLMLPEVSIEAEHPLVQRPRRKTHLIVDKDTQIGSKVMQEKISDPLLYTQPVVPLTIPDTKSQIPASLFDSPTYQKFMAPEISELWSRCAFLEPLQYMQEREEVSELEEVRAAPESGVSIMLSSEVSLEVSEEERSRPILLTPEERRSLSVQEERVLSMVSEMPEIIVELPETEEVLLSDLQRKLHSEIDRTRHSEFLSLAPHSLSRLLVSRFFFSCLVLCNQEVIRLEQAKPYGRIDITSGRQYSQD